VNEQAMLLAHPGVERLLVLNAAAQAETLEEALQAYRGHRPLAGCIVSKVDEAARMGQVLDVLIRHRQQLHFVANGQRVPEDLHFANPNYLIDCALKAAARAAQPGSPFALQDGEFDLVMGASAAESAALAAQAQKRPLHA
jgi:flagellar biosynthesis protein FlhF